MVPHVRTSSKRVALTAAAIALLTLTVAMVNVCPTSAATGAPEWAIQSVALPSNFEASQNTVCEELGSCDEYLVTVTNVGTRPTDGPIVVTDRLPEDMEIKRGQVIAVVHAEAGKEGGIEFQSECSKGFPQELRCETTESVPPGSIIYIKMPVKKVMAGAGTTVTNTAEVEGGEAGTVQTSQPSTEANTLNGSVASFGIQSFSVGVFGEGTAADAQAGDHPDSLMAALDYSTEFDEQESGGRPVEEPKTAIVDLPLGFVGDPLAAGQCDESTLTDTRFGLRKCPADSQVGTVALDSAGEAALLFKVYNMVPEPGYPATFGFEIAETIVLMEARVLPSIEGYALSIAVPAIPRATYLHLTGLSFVFFGDPSEQDGAASSSLALFSNPTDCTAGPLKASVEQDSWVKPQLWASQEAAMYEASSSQSVSGCDLLQFDPTIAVTPEKLQAGAPSGYAVELEVPQTPDLAPALATPDLKEAEVSLPEGVSLSPAAADGLAACQATGPEGIDLGNEDTPGHEVEEGEALGADGLPHAARGHCPLASQIGTVEITTPVLASPLEGHVYLAQPGCGGAGQPTCTSADAVDGDLYGLYLEAEGSGVIIKVPGSVSADPVTGRLTARFVNGPQLPFSNLKLTLTGGPRAPLTNPQRCGEATTTSALEPWSAPESGAPATPTSSFAIDEDCSPRVFAPSFTAGTTSVQAGGYSPFSVTFSRSDQDQDLHGIQVQVPEGLLGMLSSVPLCGEVQANTGTCPAASQIGHTTVLAGAGSDPLSVPEPGQPQAPVYLTAGYRGAPFGLSVVVPAVAGPFNLGDVVVRAAISVDPRTAQVTITSDPLPTILDGIPLQIKTVNVTVDRPGFMFNPTNCEASRISATITSTQGATADASSPFGVANCASLPFKPSFSASVAGRASKAMGASLVVRVSSKGGPQSGGGEANVRSVKVDLPRQLPTRLTTLQKACIAAVFEADPASCPAESDVGTATAVTPVLAHPLTGPAYLVSRGGAGFPDLEIVLQGEGVTIDLDGTTQIKDGITSSTFAHVPDAPISRFEVTLPEGPYSALAANLPEKDHDNLCGQKLMMPTASTGQNGAEIHQDTPITVEGCSTSLSFTSSIKRRSLILSVYAPAAGAVTASGKGLTTVSKMAKGQENITITLKQKRAGKFKTSVKIAFKPSGGKKQTRVAKLTFMK
jgi:hypothetical protein